MLPEVITSNIERFEGEPDLVPRVIHEKLLANSDFEAGL
jgi:hypothetical protein